MIKKVHGTIMIRHNFTGVQWDGTKEAARAIVKSFPAKCWTGVAGPDSSRFLGVFSDGGRTFGPEAHPGDWIVMGGDETRIMTDAEFQASVETRSE